MRRPGRIVVWPANIDYLKSRRAGRKIPKSDAVQSPRLDELVQACKILGLEVTSVESAARPANWWDRTGYIVVEKGRSRKTELLRRLAREAATLRLSTV